jgi:tetratricopeptide (TPR) repeat protein
VGIGPLLIVAALHAGEGDLSTPGRAEVAARGEAAFAEGVRRRDDPDAARLQFRAAAACFDELRRRGASNPTLYRNLGHSYLLAGDLPRAILTYRRGLRLAPDDRELNAGLRSARERVNYPAGSRLGRPESDSQSPWPKWFRAEWLVAGAALLYSIACLALTRWLMIRRGALLAAALTALLGAGLLTALAVRGMEARSAGPLIVIAEDGVLLRRGDSLSYPPRYETPVNRGVEGHLLIERGRWLQVELLGGEVGWVMREYVLEDEEES